MVYIGRIEHRVILYIHHVAHSVRSCTHNDSSFTLPSDDLLLHFSKVREGDLSCPFLVALAKVLVGSVHLLAIQTEVTSNLCRDERLVN